jgi:hypothetical protein
MCSVFICLAFIACRKIDSGNLEISVKFTWNQAAFQPMETFTLQGKNILFEQVRFYMGRLVLVSDSELLLFEDFYTIFDASLSGSASVENVKEGDYVGFGFCTGVHSALNTQNGALAIPAWEYPASHPLSAAQDMYWAWNPGYIFLKLEGRIDLDGDGTFGGPGETFTIHTGLDETFREHFRTGQVRIESGKTTQLHLTFDVSKLFAGYDLHGSRLNVHPLDTVSEDFIYAQEIMDNMNSAFTAWDIR